MDGCPQVIMDNKTIQRGKTIRITKKYFMESRVSYLDEFHFSALASRFLSRDVLSGPF